jgi:hypothetical protein
MRKIPFRQSPLAFGEGMGVRLKTGAADANHAKSLIVNR